MPLTDHPSGNYRFLPGIAPYSSGVVASPGYEVVQATLLRPVPYRAGFNGIARFLANEQRPQAALCGVAPPFTAAVSFDGFAEFNAGYAAILKSWGVFVEGVNPVARTNVAPVVDPPREPMLYGFSFTRPCTAGGSPTFVVAGGGELPEGVLARTGIVALGDVSAHGLAVKAQFVMNLMDSRLRGLGVDWPAATAVNVYTPHSLRPLLEDVILNRLGSAAVHGVHWHYSRPPIEEIEFEMDVRGVRHELILDGLP